MIPNSCSSLSASQFNFQTGADSTDKLTLNYFERCCRFIIRRCHTSTVAFTVNALGTAGYARFNHKLAYCRYNLCSNRQFIADFIATFENTIDNSLASIGNYQQRLTIKNDFLTAAIANSSASVSRLFDADVAKEQLNATKGQIMQQVATSMLSQLNSQPQNLLSLFR